MILAKSDKKNYNKTNCESVASDMHEHPEDDFYVHDHGDGVLHAHPFDHEHDHSHEHYAHGHVHTQTKAVLNRLSRAIGHLESVRRMVEDGRDCTDVLVQLAAVRSALNSTAKVILKDHLQHCVSEAGADTAEQLAALNEAIDRFMS